MRPTENTEIHRKSAEQIRAIESVAQENRRIANVLDQRAHMAKFVIDLVMGISCFKAGTGGGKLCGAITFSELVPSAQLAYTVLGFQPENGEEKDLIRLCDLIVASYANCHESSSKTTSKSEATTSTTPALPPVKGPAKKE